MTSLSDSMSRFFERLNATGQQSTDYDPEWRSDCETHVEGPISYWQACRQRVPVNFDGLANAVEAEIHPDIIAYYSAYWSGCLSTTSEEGPVNLIQLWNPEDFDRLISNLIGHYMYQKKQKLGFTVFIANTDPDSELFLSIDNTSGRILLEEPGKAPIKDVEKDLATFLDRLTPAANRPEIY